MRLPGKKCSRIQVQSGQQRAQFGWNAQRRWILTDMDCFLYTHGTVRSVMVDEQHVDVCEGRQTLIEGSSNRVTSRGPFEKGAIE
jgi:hypothetical protein